ncbi:glycosyltransferase family 4 protein [Bdellovibrio sp. NC01]|uniref:glycosyltransferase family 4 protein n=1 Tax=Bdellovibrio sp. NC01 TaxID=2220073 RepID=UPI001156F3EF|nr:glycosyltransferase family 4 protein [Bdellovibrio sp. NC01]QDK37509.1 hypothetical protein DOE51_07890 [Bdellovibrio sp. NC01]
MTQKKILLITNYFSPSKSVAALRTGSWVKYFDKEKFSFEVIVMGSDYKDSVQDINGISVHYINDSSCFKLQTFTGKEPRLVHFLKAAYNRLFQYFIWNRESDSIQKVAHLGRRLVQEGDFSYLMSTYPEIGPLLAAEKIKNEFPELKWISDFRDHLSWDTLNTFSRKHAERKLADSLCVTDLITVVSDPIGDEISKMKPDKVHANWVRITNGYDFSPLKNLNALSITPINIGYAGSLYGDRNLNIFLRALEEFDENINLIVIGNKKPLPNLSEKIRARISSQDRISYEELPKKLSQMHALLVTHPTTDQKGIYTSKLFDYLAIDRPILGLVDPDDVAAELIRKCSAGWVSNSDDLAGIKRCLREIVDAYRTGSMPKRNWDLIAQYHRSVGVRLLQNEIESLTNDQKN